jgi:hypothetical protein
MWENKNKKFKDVVRILHLYRKPQFHNSGHSTMGIQQTSRWMTTVQSTAYLIHCVITEED